MTRESRLVGPRAAVLALAVVAAACAGGARPEPEGPRPAGSPAAETADLEALFRARRDSARMRYTPADVRFMTGMIAHHAQALVMAGLVPERSSNSSIRTLAARIINAQKDEIARMQQWLRGRGQPVPEVHIEGTTMMVHGAEHAMHMPGMLTPEQLRELEAARGVEFDRLFLKYMIQHHRGAISMVRELFATDGAAQDEDAFRLASDIRVDQDTEIARMELMLAALPVEDGAP
ncbi:MAG TPA: DUF305 domain-containing protein [Longimicrobiales bacterium]